MPLPSLKLLRTRYLQDDSNKTERKRLFGNLRLLMSVAHAQIMFLPMLIPRMLWPDCCLSCLLNLPGLWLTQLEVFPLIPHL